MDHNYIFQNDDEPDYISGSNEYLDLPSPYSFTDTVISELPHPIKPTEEVVNPLPMVAHLSEPLLDVLGDVTYDAMFTYDDIKMEHRGQFADIVEGFTKILNYSYDVTPVKAKQHIISKAVVAPLIGFIKHEVASRHGILRVLIVGAGVGKDIRRLMSSRVQAEITCVEPDPKAYDELVKIDNVRAYNGTFSQVRSHLLGKVFDVVIANQSAHYILGVDTAPLFVSFLESALAVNGVCYGSWFDVPTIQALSQSKHTHYGHSIMCLGKGKDTYGEHAYRGVVNVSVAGSVFPDPVLEVSDVYQLFEKAPSLECNVYSGNDIVWGAGLRGPLYDVRAEFGDVVARSELGMLRCLILRKPQEMHPLSQGYSPTPHIMQARTIDHIPLSTFAVDYNKGKCAVPSDLFYFDAHTTWIGEKHDGVMGKLVMSNGKLDIYLENGNNFTYDYQCEFVGHAILQVEVTPTRVVVTDVLLPPWGQTGSFLSRWRWLERIVMIYPFPFSLQRWLSDASPAELYQLLIVAREGVVLQSLLAPPGFVRGKSGSARYVKRDYTVDLRFDDGFIYECDLEGNRLKSRPDKTVPNHPNQIKRIKKALSYNALLVHVFTRFEGVINADWQTMMKDILALVPPLEWRDEELVLFYFNQEDPVVKQLLLKTTPEFTSSVINEIRRRASYQPMKDEPLVRKEADIFELYASMPEDNDHDVMPFVPYVKVPEAIHVRGGHYNIALPPQRPFNAISYRSDLVRWQDAQKFTGEINITIPFYTVSDPTIDIQLTPKSE